MEINRAGLGILNTEKVIKTKRKCLLCNRMIDNDIRYCPYCGAQLKRINITSRWRTSSGEDMLAESGISVKGGYFRENETMKIEAYGSRIHFSAFGHWTRHFDILDGCVIKDLGCFVSMVLWSNDDNEWQDIRLKKDEHSEVVIGYVSDYMRKNRCLNNMNIIGCRFDKKV